MSRNGTRHLSQRNHEQRRMALELYRSGLSFGEVGQQLGISRSRVGFLVRQELKEMVAERREIAAEIGEMAIESARWVTKLATEVASSRCRQCAVNPGHVACRECRGQGAITDGGGGSGRVVCDACGGSGSIVCPFCLGTTYRFDPDTRMKAADRILRANDQMANLMGLYKYVPEALFGIESAAEEVADSTSVWREEVAKMTDEELEQELAGFMAPLEASDEAWEAAEEVDRQAGRLSAGD